MIRFLLWTTVAATCTYGLGLIAFTRGEQRPSVLWFIVAALCVYAIGYRFYSRFIAERILELDDSQPPLRRASPTAATTSRPPDGSPSAITSPPSPAPDHWSARSSPLNSAICPRRSGLSS